MNTINQGVLDEILLVLDLGDKQQTCFEYLFHKKGEIISRHELANEIWDEAGPEVRACYSVGNLGALISQIRRQIKRLAHRLPVDIEIETVYQQGYILEVTKVGK